ncbi:Ribonuclease H-like superfamily [Sesbania bispinosa]|nr:Ribonuclease H-like superfamily [Sesbania bispinosa]
MDEWPDPGRYLGLPGKKEAGRFMGLYSVKSGYFRLKDREFQDPQGPSSSNPVGLELWNQIWRIRTPQTVKVFLWKACHRIIPVKEELHRRRIARANLCPICQQVSESIEHTLLLCDWTKPVWFAFQVPIPPTLMNTTSLPSWLLSNFSEFSKAPDKGTLGKTLLATVIWTIWQARNNAIFQGEPPNPYITVTRAQAQINECMHALQSLVTPTNPSNQSNLFQQWRPPKQGVIKLNTDVAFSQDRGRGTIACLGRNFEGKVECGLTRNILASSSLVAEAMALREGVSLLVNLGVPKAIFELDSLSLTQACRGELMVGEITQIVKDILALKEHFVNAGFTWVGRGGNVATHLTAELASHNDLPISWVSSPPQTLRAALSRDARGFLYVNVLLHTECESCFALLDLVLDSRRTLWVWNWEKQGGGGRSRPCMEKEQAPIDGATAAHGGAEERRGGRARDDDDGAMRSQPQWWLARWTQGGKEWPRSMKALQQLPDGDDRGTGERWLAAR